MSDEDSKRKKNKRKKKKSFLDILIIVLTVILIFLVTTILVAMTFKTPLFSKSKETQTADAKENETQDNSIKETEKENQEEESVSSKPEENKTNFAVFGVDKDGVRTDVIFIVSFDKSLKTLAVVSVPRDTRVQMTDEILKGLKERNRNIPYLNGVEGVCKLNEVHAYAGDGYRNEYSVLQLEDLLGIKIDYFAKINTEGFRDVVDAIGGVDMEIKDRLYYNDPVQDLYIDLKPGFQHLDGDKAEQLVRFRSGYAQKDLKRIQVQQDFLKELFKKVKDSNVLIKNLPNLITTCFKYVETDFNLLDAVEYAKYIKDISFENISMETIPGEGGSYFDIDEEGTKEVVSRVFYSNSPLKKDESLEASDNENENDEASEQKNFILEVANGSNKNGLAKETADLLEKEGFEISLISTFSGEKTEKTRIIVNEDGIGTDLLKYFKSAEIEVNPKLISNGSDIKIILGMNEN